MTNVTLARRDALAWLASIGISLSTRPVSAASTQAPQLSVRPPDRGEYDAIVVGAGFAGVTAARELARAGMSVLVVEARNRIGGRTFVTPFAGENVELGGSWFHWEQPHLWSEVVRYGMTIEETPGATAPETSWLGNGRLHREPTDRVFGRVGPLLDRFCNLDGQSGRAAVPMVIDVLAKQDWVRKLDPLTINDRLRQMRLSREQHDLLLPILAMNSHSEPEAGSLLSHIHWWAMAEYDFGRMLDRFGRYKLVQGTNGLITAMLNDSKANLALSAPVQRIEQSGGRVTVSLRSGKQYTAGAAVLAVPMNTLADIAYEPQVSQIKLDMSRQGHAGRGTKFHVHIRERIGKWFGMAPFPNPIAFAWTEQERDDGTALVAYGPPVGLDITDDDSVQAALRRLLPKVHVVAVTGYQWTEDPYAKGTWAFYRPGQISRGLRAMQQREGAIFMAGSDIANGWRGFVDGAIETGLTAARQVRQHLNR